MIRMLFVLLCLIYMMRQHHLFQHSANSEYCIFRLEHIRLLKKCFYIPSQLFWAMDQVERLFVWHGQSQGMFLHLMNNVWLELWIVKGRLVLLLMVRLLLILVM